MKAVSLLTDLIRIDTTPGNEARGIERCAEEMSGLGYDEVTIDATAT